MRSNDTDTKIISVDMAIISALPEELEYIKEKFSDKLIKQHSVGQFEFYLYEYEHIKIVLASTGIGTAFSSSGMTLIQLFFQPTYTFLVGTAGGIKQEVAINDVVVTDKVFEAEMQGLCDIVKGSPFATCFMHPLKREEMPEFYPSDPELLAIAKELLTEGVALHIGTTVTSNAFPAPKELFTRIKSQHVVSIDMETSAVYQTAWLLNTKAIAIRGISNVLDEHGADDNLHQSDVKNSTRAASNVLFKLIDRLIKQKY